MALFDQDEEQLDLAGPSAPIMDAQGNNLVEDDRKRRIRQYLEDAQKRSQKAKLDLTDNTLSPEDRMAAEKRTSDRDTQAALFNALDFSKNKNTGFQQYAKSANALDAQSMQGTDARAQQASQDARLAANDLMAKNNAANELDEADAKAADARRDSDFKGQEQARVTADRNAEDDVSSPESALARSLAKKMMPSGKFDNLSATDIKRALPSLTSIYKIEQDKLDRAETRAAKDAAGKEKAEEKKLAGNTRREDAVRQQYLNSPAVKQANDVQIAYDKVKAAANNPSAAGDLSLIFGYMKMLDPGSTVREGEFANAQNAASLPDTVRNQYNKLLTGQRLNPKQRQDFTNQASKVYEAQRSAVTKLNKQYEDFAAREGLNPKNIIFDIGAPEPTAVTQSVAPTSAADLEKLSDAELEAYINGK